MDSIQKFADTFLSKKYRGECIHVDPESGMQVNNNEVVVDPEILLKTYEILRSQTTAPIAVRNIGYLLLIAIFNCKHERTKVRNLSYLIDVSNPTIYIALNQLKKAERCILTDNDIKVKNKFEN